MSVATEIAVRMGEAAVASQPGDSLVSFGLGSCIGLVLIDPARSIAGLAHVMLPGPAVAGRSLATFADTGVPHLLELLLAAGALKHRLQAVLAGGAQMFASGGSGLEIGLRNDEAVRAALATLRIPVIAERTGGDKGRTVRVRLEEFSVTVKEAGGTEEALA
jgi:chemotaxis protein CheD